MQAKTVIPSASFMYFANVLNSYLNDGVNTPRRVREFCRTSNADFRCVFLKPMESLDLDDNDRPKQQESSLSFWENALTSNKTYIQYEDSYSIDQLSKLFTTYCERLKKKNAWWLIRAVSVSAHRIQANHDEACGYGRSRPCGFGEAQDLVRPGVDPEIALHSESLAFHFSSFLTGSIRLG